MVEPQRVNAAMRNTLENWALNLQDSRERIAKQKVQLYEDLDRLSERLDAIDTEAQAVAGLLDMLPLDEQLTNQSDG